MKTLDQVRRVEVAQPDGSWLSVHMEQLEPGDVFRMFEPDGTPVTGELSERTEWVADCEASVRIRDPE